MMQIGTWEQPKGALGIRAVEFRHDGSVVAQMHDGTTVPIGLPTGWKAQAVGPAIIYQCPCGSLVLGAPVHECPDASE